MSDLFSAARKQLLQMEPGCRHHIEDFPSAALMELMHDGYVTKCNRVDYELTAKGCDARAALVEEERVSPQQRAKDAYIARVTALGCKCVDAGWVEHNANCRFHPGMTREDVCEIDRASIRGKVTARWHDEEDWPEMYLDFQSGALITGVEPNLALAMQDRWNALEKVLEPGKAMGAVLELVESAERLSVILDAVQKACETGDVDIVLSTLQGAASAACTTSHTSLAEKAAAVRELLRRDVVTRRVERRPQTPLTRPPRGMAGEL